MTELVGKRAEELGGEAGLTEAVLALAERQGTAGRSPFAALVVRGGGHRWLQIMPANRVAAAPSRR